MIDVSEILRKRDFKRRLSDRSRLNDFPRRRIDNLNGVGLPVHREHVAAAGRGDNIGEAGLRLDGLDWRHRFRIDNSDFARLSGSHINRIGQL